MKKSRKEELIPCQPPVDYSGSLADWQRAMDIHAPEASWGDDVPLSVYELILEEAEE